MIRLGSLLVLATLASGCGATVAAAGIYGYVQYEKNEGSLDYEVKLPDVWKATLDQLAEMGYQVPADQRTLREGKGTVNLSGVYIEVKPHHKYADVTRVRARFGTFQSDENHEKIRTLLDGIQKRLGLE